MKQTVRLGRVAGIPVGMNWSVLVVIGVIAFVLAQSVLPVAAPGSSVTTYWLVALPTAALFLAALLAHELAHALVARRKGVQVRSITLWLLGGVAQLDGEPPDPRADFQIAIAGPLASLGAAAAFFGISVGFAALGVPAVVTMALAWVGLMNAFLAVFNMLPGAPLDGGRVLRAALWRFLGDRHRAAHAATTAGRATGIMIAGAGFLSLLLFQRFDGLWLVLVGWFLFQAAGAEQRTGSIRAAATDVLVRDVMTPRPDLAPAWLTVAMFVRNVATGSRQSVFPVVGFDGAPQAVVTLGLLASVTAERADQRVDAVATALPAEYVVGPDVPVDALLDRAPVAGALIAVVVDGGQVVGMVTVDDLRKLVQLRHLQQVGTPPPVPAAVHDAA